MNSIRVALAVFVLVFVSTPSFAQGSEEIVYFHADAIGSVRLVTDANGQVVGQYDYLPFGEAWQAPALPETRRFGGKERDAETGLDYFGARYYASANGRFATVDPVLNIEAALVDPQRWNRYAYVTNNPFRYVDPDGRDIWDAFAGVGNAFASNFSVAPRGSGNSDYRFGQFIGDLASVPAGFSWANGGVGLFFGGVGGAPATGGTSLVVSAGGAAMVAQGVVAAGKGVANVGVFMSQNTRDSGAKPDIRPTKPEKNTLEGAQDQLDGVTAADEHHKSTGKGDMIQSKKKSEQRLDNQLKKVKKQEDLNDLLED